MHIIYAVEYNMYNNQHEDTQNLHGHNMWKNVKAPKILNVICPIIFSFLPLLKEVGKAKLSNMVIISYSLNQHGKADDLTSEHTFEL